MRFVVPSGKIGTSAARTENVASKPSHKTSGRVIREREFFFISNEWADAQRLEPDGSAIGMSLGVMVCLGAREHTPNCGEGTNFFCRTRVQGVHLDTVLDRGTAAPAVMSRAGALARSSTGGAPVETTDRRGRRPHCSEPCREAPSSRNNDLADGLSRPARKCVGPEARLCSQGGGARRAQRLRLATAVQFEPRTTRITRTVFLIPRSSRSSRLRKCKM